jgi:hypothetical protein
LPRLGGLPHAPTSLVFNLTLSASAQDARSSLNRTKWRISAV